MKILLQVTTERVKQLQVPHVQVFIAARPAEAGTRVHIAFLFPPFDPPADGGGTGAGLAGDRSGWLSTHPQRDKPGTLGKFGGLEGPPLLPHSVWGQGHELELNYEYVTRLKKF